MFHAEEQQDTYLDVAVVPLGLSVIPGHPFRALLVVVGDIVEGDERRKRTEKRQSRELMGVVANKRGARADVGVLRCMGIKDCRTPSVSRRVSQLLSATLSRSAGIDYPLQSRTIQAKSPRHVELSSM